MASEQHQCAASKGSMAREAVHCCKECKASLHSYVACKAVWMPADNDYFCGKACIVAYNEKNEDQFEVQQRPGGLPVSSDADEDEEDGHPRAHDEIDDDDPNCVGSPTLQGPPSRRLRRRVIAAAPTAASGAARAPGSLQSFGFAVALGRAAPSHG